MRVGGQLAAAVARPIDVVLATHGRANALRVVPHEHVEHREIWLEGVIPGVVLEGGELQELESYSALAELRLPEQLLAADRVQILIGAERTGDRRSLTRWCGGDAPRSPGSLDRWGCCRSPSGTGIGQPMATPPEPDGSGSGRRIMRNEVTNPRRAAINGMSSAT